MTLPGRVRKAGYVARNEFVRVFFHPASAVILLLLALLAVLYGLECAQEQTWGRSNEGLYYYIGRAFMFTSLYGVVVALFVGATSVAAERRTSSLGVLLSKPLSGRELVIGKMVGLNCYLIAIASCSMFFSGLTLSLCYFAPADPVDFLSKLAIYVLISVVYLSLNMAIALVISIAFTDLLVCATLAMTWLFLEHSVGWTWISPLLDNFSPINAMCNLYINHATDLQSTTLTAGHWFEANIIDLSFMIAAVLLLSVIAIVLFNLGDKK